MMNWQLDPEIAVMRREFIDSLQDRLLELKKLHERFNTGQSHAEVCDALQMLTHKLAGLAATYGFPVLTEIGGAIEDMISSGQWQMMLGNKKSVSIKYLSLMEEAISEAILTEMNPNQLYENPIMIELTSAAESLHD